MINEEIVKRILLEKPKRKQYTQRDIPFEEIDKIYTIIGPRRAGKTYFLFQLIDHFISEGVPDSRIVYINFEDERLSDIEKDDLQRILDIYYGLYPENLGTEIFFMFDEIQNVPLWPKFIRRLHDKEKCKIFVTGSSAKLLSKEIATELRGRSWTYRIFPFSFREYLSYKGVKLTKKSPYSDERYKIIRHFEEYQKTGGFPETFDLDENSRITLHQNYFETVMFRDVVERYKIKNVEIVKDVFKGVLNNFARLFSINKFYNLLKSVNKSVSKNFIYPLVEYMEETMYFFFIPIYSESYKTQMVNPKKAYVIDNGLIRSVATKEGDVGWFYENLVAIELMRRNRELYYYSGKMECDFISKDRVSGALIPIQVTLAPDEEREVAGLIEAMDACNSNEGIVLTKSEDKTINAGNKIIRIMPLWKWLLE